MLPHHRTSYDTALKHLYRKGLEKAIPQALRHAIPRSNISRWRTEPDDKYLGHPLNHIAASELQLLQAFAENQAAKRAFRAWCKLALAFTAIFSCVPQFHARLRAAKKQIVAAVESAAASVSTQYILRFLGISRGTYQTWKVQVLRPCHTSALFSCLKTLPQQASRNELQAINEMLANPRYASWPVRSVAWHALRTGKVLLSVQTWYKYANMLGINRKLSRKPRHPEGFRASAPNAAWHADVTIVKTLDGLKHYIYLVVDNFSRKVLTWQISTRLSASIRVATLREAAQQLLEARHHGTVDLIVDGGPENNNATVTNFIQDSRITIHKLIALRDVHFSNSIVEAVNKVVKYRYLFPKNLPDGDALQKAVADCIHDYNDIRPHGSLGGLTPSEAYRGMASGSLQSHEKLKAARTARIARNQASRCQACMD